MIPCRQLNCIKRVNSNNKNNTTNCIIESPSIIQKHRHLPPSTWNIGHNDVCLLNTLLQYRFVSIIPLRIGIITSHLFALSFFFCIHTLDFMFGLVFFCIYFIQLFFLLLLLLMIPPFTQHHAISLNHLPHPHTHYQIYISFVCYRSADVIEISSLCDYFLIHFVMNNDLLPRFMYVNK